MGKGIKRPGKPTKDFAKKKFKVGKRLKAANNETTVDVRVRKLSLPGQTALESKDGYATSEKHLTLKELLAQCGHYSEKVRKRAVAGLADLLTRHPAELSQHASRVVHAIALLLADADKAVRAGVHDLCSRVVLPALPPPALAPFLPLLVAHISGALTHIVLDVRTDALHFLDLLVAHCPAGLVAGHRDSVLRHFCDALSQGQRNRTLKARSLDSLANTLRKLNSFLHAGSPASELVRATGAPPTTPQHGDKEPQPGPRAPGAAWSAPGELSDEAAAAHDLDDKAAIQRLRGAIPATPSLPGALSYLALAHPNLQLPGVGQRANLAASHAGGGNGDADGDPAARLVTHLIVCWEDCSPSELAVAPEATGLECLVLILENLVLAAAMVGVDAAPDPGDSQSTVHLREQFRAFIYKRVTPYFPTTVPGVRPAAAIAHDLVRFNMLCALLVTAFLPALLAPQPEPRKARKQGAALSAAPLPTSTDAALAPARCTADVGRRSSDDALDLLSRSAVLASSAYAGHSARDPRSEASTPVAVVPEAARHEEPSAAAQSCLARLVEHFMAVLLTGVAVPAQQGLRSGGDGLKAPATAFAAALRGLEAALEHADAATRARVLQELTQLFASKLPAAKRAAVVAFQHRIGVCQSSVGHRAVPEDVLLRWIGDLPRAIWESGGKQPSLVRDALEVLHACARTAAPGSTMADALLGLQPLLLPGFALAEGGALAAKRRGCGLISLTPGPLAAMDASTVALAVDLLFYMPQLTAATLASLQSIALSSVYPAATVTRIAALVATRSHSCEPLPALRLLAALATCDDARLAASQRTCKSLAPDALDAPSAAGVRSHPWARHSAVADAVARGLCQMERLSPGVLDAVHSAVAPRTAAANPPGPAGSRDRGGDLRWNYGGLVVGLRALEYGVAPPAWRESMPGRAASYVLSLVRAKAEAALGDARGGAGMEQGADEAWPSLAVGCTDAPTVRPVIDVLQLVPAAVAPTLDHVARAISAAAESSAAAPPDASARLVEGGGPADEAAACVQAGFVLVWALLRSELLCSGMDGGGFAAMARVRAAIITAAASVLAGDSRSQLALRECEQLSSRLMHLFPALAADLR